LALIAEFKNGVYKASFIKQPHQATTKNQCVSHWFFVWLKGASSD
jgi:hypothetical protein